MNLEDSQVVSEVEEISDHKQTGFKDEDVKKIAKLAKLRLEDDDLEGIKNDLNTIIGYFAQLNELDTENVKPMHHVLQEKNVWRDDTPTSKERLKEIIENGPLTENNYFKVPKIMDT